MEINILELASELADAELVEKHSEWVEIYKYNEENEDVTYTDKAQIIFNELYDKYYKIIESTKI